MEGINNVRYDLMGYGHNEGDYIGDLEYLSDILESGFIDLGGK